MKSLTACLEKPARTLGLFYFCAEKNAHFGHSLPCNWTLCVYYTLGRNIVQPRHLKANRTGTCTGMPWSIPGTGSSTKNKLKNCFLLEY